jgi:hypothetical protein
MLEPIALPLVLTLTGSEQEILRLIFWGGGVWKTNSQNRGSPYGQLLAIHGCKVHLLI